jgi:hypothetical protein
MLMVETRLWWNNRSINYVRLHNFTQDQWSSTIDVSSQTMGEYSRSNPLCGKLWDHWNLLVAKSKYSIDCFLIFCKVSTPLVNTTTVVRKKLQKPREWLILLRGMCVFIVLRGKRKRVVKLQVWIQIWKDSKLTITSKILLWNG